MGFWKRLFGGQEKTAHDHSSSNSLEEATRVETAARTIKYAGGDPEEFYAEMARHLSSNHGSLVRVDFLEGFPEWSFLLLYEDGTRIQSLKHISGDYDLHHLTLGYTGEGTRLMSIFLESAGLIVTLEQIAAMSPGQSIVHSNDRTEIISAVDEIKGTESVRFVSEGQEEIAGMPATVVRYEADTEEAALSFLENQVIEGQSVYILVDTPEGTVGKDRMGML
jgi:hypothetical protein